MLALLSQYYKFQTIFFDIKKIELLNRRSNNQRKGCIMIYLLIYSGDYLWHVIVLGKDFRKSKIHTKTYFRLNFNGCNNDDAARLFVLKIQSA